MGSIKISPSHCSSIGLLPLLLKECCLNEPLVEVLLDHLGRVLVVGGVLLAGVDAHLQHLRPHVLVHVSLVIMLTISLGAVPVLIGVSKQAGLNS